MASTSNEKLPFLQFNRKRNSTAPVLVIHGGAGTMSKDTSTPEQRAEYRRALAGALRAGHEVLREVGEAMDAAVAAVSYMEDCPLFNAGKGAVFNIEGKHELESSIMLSQPPSSHPHIPSSRRTLSLTLLSHVRNPSKAVRALYLSPSRAPHTMLSGTTAERLASELGEELVDPSYFYTEKRWKEHERGLPHFQPLDGEEGEELPQGTVGAVALDARGCIASVTSTGGKTNKLVGRIGDTPLAGSGFWAESWTPQPSLLQRLLHRKSQRRSLGVSGTGDGDYFIRFNTASTLSHRCKFKGEGLDDAARAVIEDLRRNDGIGGVIALDEEGNVSMRLNSSGMYRGVIREDGIARTAIFADDELEDTDS